MEKQQRLEAKYGLYTAISMVVGQVIGSGIFFKIDDVLLAIKGNVMAGLVGFVVVGVSMVFAAISMSNYTSFCKGGLLEYVEYRFGKKMGAYVAWGYLLLFFPLLTAVLLVVSGIYIVNFLAEFIKFEPNFLHYSVVGLVNGFLFLVGNVFSPKAIGLFQQFTTVLKLIPLIFISALGIMTFLGGEVSSLNPSETAVLPTSGDSFWLLVSASLVPIAFSMDGWYTVLQISDEIKKPEKNLPRSLIIGSLIVLLVYVFYYLGIVSKMDSGEIISLKDTYITEFARKIASDGGAIVLQLFVIISVLGACNGLVLATTRVPYQFYHQDYAKKFWNLGKLDNKTRLPINSMILSFLLIIVGIALFYITNVLPFFTERNYDISAIPIAFIYIVNGALFLGLFKLIKENKMKGNKWVKYLMLLFAISGNAVVLMGTLLTPNGVSYFVLIILGLLLGKLVIKN